MADLKDRRNDDEYQNEREAELGELFADALTRVEAGETVGAILAACPTEHRAQLRSMLQLGEVLFAQQNMPIPNRSSARRSASRQAFLQQATQARAELLSVSAIPSADATPAPSPQATRPSNRFNFGHWLAGAWSRLQEATTVRGYSLAPLLATLLIALIASLATAQVTQAAVPGDLTYPVKNWARSAEMVLTPPDLREPVAERRKREVEQEIAVVAQGNEQRTEADLNRLVVQATFTLPFGGFNGRTLKFGDLTVFPSFQPNANDLVTRNPMKIDGDLVEGAMVELTVLILPGSTDYVQGAYAKVIAPPPTLTPPPEGPPSALPVSTRPALPPCTPQRPAGWEIYTVRSGDTLSGLARLADTDIDAVNRVNCFESEFVISGQAIYLPAFVLPTEVPPVETATPTVTPQETPTAAPTASETPIAPTAEPSATSEQTTEPTAQPTKTALPDPSATPVPTLEPTTAPGATPTPTETAEPSSTPTATEQPTTTATVATPQTTATPTASATPEGNVTVEATTTPGVEITPTEPQVEGTATAVGQEEPTRAPPTATSPQQTPTATTAATAQPTVESAIATTAPQPVAPTDVPAPTPTNALPPVQEAPSPPPSAPTGDADGAGAGGASTGAADNAQAGEQSASQP